MLNRLVPVLLSLAALAAAQDAPERPHLQAGVLKLRSRDFAGAEADFTRAIEAAPGSAVCYLARAQARHGQDKDKEALEDCDRALELDEATGGAYALRAQVRMALGDYTGAVEDFDRVIEANAEDMGAVYGRGLARERLHLYEGAIADYTRVVEANPRARQALWRLGLVHEYALDFEAAIAAYNKALALDAEWGAGYRSRAACKTALGDLEGAAEDYEVAVYCDESDPGTYHARGRLRARTGQLDAARKDFEKAHELAPTDGHALFERARFLFDIGAPAEALDPMLRSIAKDKDSADQEYKQLYLCLIRMRCGKRDEGVAGLKAFLAARGAKGDWYENVARFLTGAITEEALLEAARDGNPHRQREQTCEASWYAGAVRLSAGEKEKAKALFERCVATRTTHFIEYESATIALLPQ